MEIVNCVCYLECRNSNANQMLSLFLLLTFDLILLANVGYHSYIFSSGCTEQEEEEEEEEETLFDPKSANVQCITLS